MMKVRHVRIDHDGQQFLAVLVTEEYSEDGDIDTDEEILYPGSDLIMAIQFGVDNAQNLGLPLMFSAEVLSHREFSKLGF